MKYKCITEFQIELVDDDGFSTEKYETIQKDSLWIKSDDDYRFIGGEVRLEKEEDDTIWIEIPESSLKEDFELIIG